MSYIFSVMLVSGVLTLLVRAGGDAVTGAATVILAMGAGKTGEKSIDEYIKSKK